MYSEQALPAVCEAMAQMPYAKRWWYEGKLADSKEARRDCAALRYQALGSEEGVYLQGPAVRT